MLHMVGVFFVVVFVLMKSCLTSRLYFHNVYLRRKEKKKAKSNPSRSKASITVHSAVRICHGGETHMDQRNPPGVASDPRLLSEPLGLGSPFVNRGY